MSYLPKMSKNPPREYVEEKNGNKKAFRRGCLSLDLNQSLEDMDPELSHILNSTDIIQQPPMASEPLQGGQAIHDEALEYSCNFCPKKFSNKQALGGHQNAHKLDKVAQKRAWQGDGANFGYTGNESGSGMTSFYFPNPLNQAPKMVSPHYPQSVQDQMYAHGYPGFMFPMTHEFGVNPMSYESGVNPMSYESGVNPKSHESGVNPFSHKSVVLALGCYGKTPTSPEEMSFKKRMEQGTSTSKGKSKAVAKDDHAEHHRELNNAGSQNHDDELDLSLKL